MKAIPLLLVAIAASAAADAQTLRSPDGRSLRLPVNFVVQPEGIRFVPLGAPEPMRAG